MNKKLILGLGSLAAAALPVTAVFACDSKNKKDTTKKLENPTSPTTAETNIKVEDKNNQVSPEDKKEAETKTPVTTSPETPGTGSSEESEKNKVSSKIINEIDDENQKSN